MDLLHGWAAWINSCAVVYCVKCGLDVQKASDRETMQYNACGIQHFQKKPHPDSEAQKIKCSTEK